MDLENQVKSEDKKIKRRSFLKKAVSTIGALVLGSYIASGVACKSPSGPTPPPTPVTMQFEVYNHTQGYRTNFTKTAMSGDPITISVSALNIMDVDPQRIAVRENDFLGKLVNFSNSGTASFSAPTQNTNYKVILFNATNNASYQWMDDQSSLLYNETRNIVVYRADRDGLTGPEESWQNVFQQLNAALDLGWVKWGSITSKPNAK